MSTKNFVSYGDAETLFAGVKDKIDDITGYEEYSFTWTGRGFDSHLDDTDSYTITSMSITPIIYTNEELVIDLGPNWSTKISHLYGYKQAYGWITEETQSDLPRGRYYTFKGIGGRVRFGVPGGTDTSEIRMYKRSGLPYIQTKNKYSYRFNGKKATFYGDSVMYGVISGESERANPTIASIFIDGLGMPGSQNRAVSGASYTNVSGRSRILTQIENYLVNDASDFVFIQGGINDWASKVQLETFENAVKETYDYVTRYNYGASVFVISPTPVTPDWAIGTKEYLNEYRKIIERQAILHDFEYINGVDIGTSCEGSYFYSDGLHLSQAGYTRVGINLVDHVTKQFDIDGNKRMYTGGIGWTNKQDSEGRPIYKYTYNGSNSANVGFNNVELRNAYGWCSDGQNSLPLGWTDNNNYVFSAYLQSNGNISVTKPSNYSSFEVVFEFVVL